jgi:hypothetical protein
MKIGNFTGLIISGLEKRLPTSTRGRSESFSLSKLGWKGKINFSGDMCEERVERM